MREGIIGGMTPSLVRYSPAEVVEFTNRFQRLSKYPLLLGWGGISYSGGTDVRLGQAMRLAAMRSADLCYQAWADRGGRVPRRWASTWPALRTST